MSESKQKEIEKCKEMLKNPTLGFSQRSNLEIYLKSLEEENNGK